MNRYQVVAKSFVALAAVVSATTAITALTAPAQAKPPCSATGPTVYCESNGQYYINSCWAARAGATGCTVVVFPS